MNAFLNDGRPTGNQSLWLWGVFFAYVTLTLTSFAFYEPWRDEADAWLVVQDMSIPQLFHHLQYMGHPSLWYLILMPFAKAGLPYVTMHVVHFAIVYSVALVFLFRAPFPVITKIFFLFSFFMSFEYALVARNYSIAILLLFLIATWFPQRFERPFIYATLVFLLFHTNVINLSAAGLFMGEFIWETLWKREQRSGKNALAILVMLVGMGVVLYQLYPTEPDVNHALSSFQPNFRLGGAIIAIINGILAGSNHHYVYFNCLLAFSILGLFIILLDRDKKIGLFFVLNLLWVLYIFTFKYTGSLRHHGFILIYIIVSYWLTTYTSSNTFSLHDRKGFLVLLSAVLAYLSLVSFSRHYDSITNTTSGGKALAGFIIRNGHTNDTIIADYSEYASSALPYLREASPGKMLWFAYRKEFGSYSHLDNRFYTQYSSNYFQKKSLQNALGFAANLPKDHILLVLNYPLNNPETYRLYEVFRTQAAILPEWNPAYKRSESFWVYALK